MNRVSRRTGSAWRWGIIPILLLLPLLVWPLGAVAWRGLSPAGTPSADAILEVARHPFYMERLAFTTGQALGSMLLSVLIGLPAAYVLSRVRFPGRGVVRAVLTVPFVLPSIVVALAFRELLGPAGWLTEAARAVGLPATPLTGTFAAILLAHVFLGAAVVVRIVGGTWGNLDPQQEEAARLLGANRRRTFFAVTLPALFPAIGAAALLVFAFSFASLGVVLVLGAPRLDTLSAATLPLAQRLVQMPQVAVLSVLQVIAMLVALTLYAALQRTAASRVRLRPGAVRLPAASWRQGLLLLLVLMTMGPLVLLPIAALIAGAVTSEGVLTGRHFAALLTHGGASGAAPIDAIRWSVTYAAGASVIALVAGASAAMALARTRGRVTTLLDTALMLPLAVPAVVLGFAYVTTFDRDWYDLRGSVAIVLCAHALLATPFVVRSVLPAARAMNPHLPDAAAVLGASSRRAWRRIELPILARSMLVGAVLAFTVSLGQLGATLLLQRGTPTMPVAIFEALAEPGADALGRALALSTILMGVTVVAFLIIERFRYRNVGEF